MCSMQKQFRMREPQLSCGERIVSVSDVLGVDRESEAAGRVQSGPARDGEVEMNIGGWTVYKQEEHCLCDDCQTKSVPSMLTEFDKQRILREANAIAAQAYRRSLSDLTIDALMGRAA